MNKKVGFIAGGVVIVAVFAAVISLVLLRQPESPVQEPNLAGTWKVYQNAGDRLSDEFLTFTADSVDYYKGDVETPFASATYEVKGTTLTIEALGKEFTVRVLSNNQVVLTEPNTIEWKLHRIAENEITGATLPKDTLVGSWNCVMMAGEVRENEVLDFTETTITDTRDGKTFLSTSYAWIAGQTITLDDPSMVFLVYRPSADVVILYDTNDGYLWELHKSN